MKQNIFTAINRQKVGSNTFNLSHSRMQSMKMGQLTPIMVMPVIPGDKFSIQTSSMVRMAPMIAPIMHQINVYTHFFFVPTRILWENWNKWISGGPEGDYAGVHPYIAADFASLNIGGLADYMGLPVQMSGTVNISAVPVAAYIKVYNDYYRDQNMQPDELPSESLIDPFRFLQFP